jgi:hypothetical protein
LAQQDRSFPRRPLSAARDRSLLAANAINLTRQAEQASAN